MHSTPGILSSLKLIVYNDAKGFGGHEVQTLKAYRWFLAEGAEVYCYYRSANQRWRETLEQFESEGNFHLHAVELPHIIFHRLYHFFNPRLTRELSEKFKSHHADAVFVSQGNIEISGSGSLAAKRAGIPCLSYIPLCHSFTELGSHHGSLRNLFNTYLAKTPTYWLTNSLSMKARLRERGARQPIDILPNAIEPLSPGNRKTARIELGIPQDAMVIGMVGRLEAKQKGCDIFLKSLQGIPENDPLRKTWLFILGDGKEAQALVAGLEAAGWHDRVIWNKWCSNPEAYYPVYDLIIMPSHYEGVPLVMQEAILLNIPIAATNVDGLGETLPRQWTCSPGDPLALKSLLNKFLQNPSEYRKPLKTLKEHVEATNNRVRFEQALMSSLSNLLPGQIVKNDVASRLETVEV